MCGIAGIIGNLTPDRNILNKFLESISHRGPDHRGFFYDSKMIFGMNIEKTTFLRLILIRLLDGDLIILDSPFIISNFIQKMAQYQ